MSNFEEKVELLIEERKSQALEKQLSIKLTKIAKFLGKPIMSQRSLNTSWHEDFVYDPDNINNIKEVQDDEDTYQIGYYFDGLAYGINLSISMYVSDNDYGNRIIEEINVKYNGYLVYSEQEGTLVAYAPFAKWEDSVNMFYDGALQIEKKKLAAYKEAKRIKDQEKVNSFWSKFKSLWGY